MVRATLIIAKEITQSSTADKKGQLLKIARFLGIDLKVEIV